MTWLLIVVVLLIMAFFVVRGLARKAAGMPLLSAAVATPDGKTYVVDFEQLHPQFQPVEYVRLILGFAARAVQLTNTSDQSYHQLAIQQLIEHIGGSTPDSIEANQYEVLDEDWQLMKLRISEGSTPSSGKAIKMRLGYLDAATRSIWVDLPPSWYHNQFYHTLIALIETSLPKLDDVLRGKLINSCKLMGKAYMGNREAKGSAAVAASIPNEVYMASTTVVAR